MTKLFQICVNINFQTFLLCRQAQRKREKGKDEDLKKMLKLNVKQMQHKWYLRFIRPLPGSWGLGRGHVTLLSS